MTDGARRIQRGRSGPSPSSVRTGSPVLIGRDAELSTLATAIAASPSVAFVEGEAGVGKTRLVAELVSALRTGPAWVTTGYCRPLCDPFPYGVIFECLRACGDRLGEPTAVTGALRPHLPELADRLPVRPEPLGDPAAERYRLFRAVRDLLAAVGPAVLVIEDVHWADHGTRQLLRFIMTNPPPGLSLLVTFRREDLPADAPLGRAFRPPPGTTAAHLVLGPLDTEGVRGLVEAILGGRTVPAGFAETMRQRTAGIPFLVEETTYSLCDLDRGVRFDGAARRLLDNAEVPALLHEAMAARMRALPGAARSLAEAAAVLAVPATAGLLGAVAQVGGCEEVTRLVDNAVLVEIAENEFGYRHALAQRAVSDALPGPDRRALHLRALAALARLDRPPLVRLAAHARHAGLLDDWLRHSEGAADAALEAGDASTAIDLLCAAVAEPSLAAEDVDRMATKLCRYALSGLHHDGVIAQIERLSSDSRLSGGVRGEVRLWLGLLLVRKTGEMDRGRAHIEVAVDALRDRPDRRLRGMAVLALPYLGTAPIAESRAWLDQVDDGLGELPAGAPRTSLLADVVGAQLISGDPRAWHRIALLPAPSDPGGAEQTRELARVHFSLADACSWIGHYARAWEHLHTGLNLAAQAGASAAVGTAETTRIRLDWLAGDWEGLEERAERMAQTYTHLLPVTSELQLVLGWLATARGDWDQAESCYRATRMSQPDSALIPVANAATGGMITMLLDRGDVAAACAHAGRGTALLRRKGLWAWAGDLAPQAVEAYLGAGRGEDAHALVEDMRVGLAGLDAPLARAALTACRAQLALADGDPAGAARLFETAIRRYERLDLPYRTARLTEQAARGRPADARALGELARSYERLGAPLDAARCRHLVRDAAAPSGGRRG
ncbi:ATP-binding protein [Actinomadura macra]|uniref:ATP-binding protein n=1 Tax=Actinomadura macra TaxID=46164 RepID=UPI000AD82884|nr:AAA family ATPase [Actinomadura macra]